MSGIAEDPDLESLHARLRAWAKGVFPLEAGVELLIRARLLGAVASAGALDTWEAGETDRDGDLHAEAGAWIDTQALRAGIAEGGGGYLSAGERRLFLIAASLLGAAPVDLNEALPGLDRSNLTVVLAALAHANGSHEHSHMPLDDAGVPIAGPDGRIKAHAPGPLFEWPQ